MNGEDFSMSMQRYVADIAISASTLRNQGDAGVVTAAREFLSALALKELLHIDASQYPRLLARWTGEMQASLPVNARCWGTARKAVNVFMVQTGASTLIIS